MPHPRPRTALLALAAVLAGTAAATAAPTGARPRPARSTTSLRDALTLAGKTERPVAPEERQAVPEDRYALAGGCYVMRSTAAGGYVARAGGSFAATAPTAATATRFHFQAYDLGKYLLFGADRTFLAAEPDPLPGGTRPLTEPVTGYARGTGDETLAPVRGPALGALDGAHGAADDASRPARETVRGDGVVAAAAPSGAAEWVVRQQPNGAFTLGLPVDDGDPAVPGPLEPRLTGVLAADRNGALSVTPDGTGNAPRFTFELATGCAGWPEVEVNVTGTPAATAPYAESRGYVDAHLHMMAFEFLGGRARCGRPWHPYGVTHALVDCPDHEPGGHGAVLEQVLSGGNPVEGHDTAGWPTFGYWPHHDSLTHEQVYYKWLERAWRGGVRLFTNLLVDNGVLCEIYPYKKNSCNEMDGVRLQAQRLRELERYVDAQSGGPGEGWFRIVTDPFEARRVVNAGKLAVVMGIEVSVPFDCGEYVEIARCSATDIERRLDEVYALGVRQMELTNKFDNALTGVTGDANELGVLVNSGNKYETGHNWKMETCTEPDGHTEHRHDKQQYNLADSSGGAVGRDAIFGAVLDLFGPTGAAPVYPAGPHCNTIGLNPLGRTALDGLMRRGMIFDPDHMSAKARGQALDHLTAAGYSGVVSSHSWADDPTYRRILGLGGVVTPHAGDSASFLGKWRAQRRWADPRFVFGISFGSDVNGFSAQGGPRHPAPGTGVGYPFTALGGVTVDRQVSGRRTYDVNVDGVDHYGLYPDWVEDVRVQAGADGDAFVADMARGVEVYLQMWERAVGVAANACRPDVADLTRAQFRRAQRGMTWEQVLAALGQPDVRDGSSYTYCVDGDRLRVRFDATGRVG